ncbi:hypothetical protein Golax_010633 [Gossypium laxum]|uniref:Pectinesterase inhibitor domain-containing protein n=1 Tax=Gossypium laxum TaxID=34288 RepID=A0A7J8ZJH0_9ROSI|nr:hypothetical protein [Gossypium laxum]
MKPLFSVPFLTFLFFYFYSVPTLSSYVYDASATTTTVINSTDFIRTSCYATLYPDICYTSLYGYANAIQQDPARLARAAISVSLSKARNMAVYNMGDAVDEIRGSLKQMQRVVAPGSESFRFQMGNVQTWMSAALTDEETCTDGFEDVADGPMKTEVCKRAAKVKKFTSNALALVNSYAEKGTM